MKKFLMAMVLAVVLAACGAEKPAIHSTEPFHIASVEALGPTPATSSPAQLEDLRARTAALAAYVPETGNPRLLRLRIVRFHEKNPGMSILIGDSNNMTVSAEVLAMDSTSVMGNFLVTVSNDAALNGVIGAAIAAGQDEEKVMRKLNAAAADAVFEKIYGTKAWKAWTERH